MVDKGNYRHFMEKEIYEQPEVISHTLANYLDFTTGTVKALDMPFDFASIHRLAISACGTAYLAGLIGKYWFERLAGLPVDIDVASEFRYREIPLSDKDAAIFISQSGETADTLASLRYCRSVGHADRLHRQWCANRPWRANPTRSSRPLPAPRLGWPPQKPLPASFPCLRRWRLWRRCSAARSPRRRKSVWCANSPRRPNTSTRR